jgi:hypothetical protein
VILTDDAGRPFERPSRSDFATLADFAQALHEFNDRVHACANDAFARAFERATKGEEPTD